MIGSQFIRWTKIATKKMIKLDITTSQIIKDIQEYMISFKSLCNEGKKH